MDMSDDENPMLEFADDSDMADEGRVACVDGALATEKNKAGKQSHGMNLRPFIDEGLIKDNWLAATRWAYCINSR